MPEIVIAKTGVVALSAPVEPGTYLASRLVMGSAVREGALFLAPGARDLLLAGSNTLIWTDGLAVCFPVVFIFSNGDLGLVHATSSAVQDLKEWLSRSDLLEIQVFIKKKPVRNQFKVYGFFHNLFDYYRDNSNIPRLMMQETPPENYSVALCYRSASGEPVIVVGESMRSRGMASSQEECQHKEECLTPYLMKLVDKSMLPKEEEIQKDYDNYVKENSFHSQHFQPAPIQKQNDSQRHDNQSKTTCCTLM